MTVVDEEDKPPFPGGERALTSGHGTDSASYPSSDDELRRILQKGTSFDPLTQEQIALALSHLNSYPRESLGWRTPYDVFVERHGDEGKAFLANLGIVRIPVNQVTRHPFLLGEKCQKAADKATIRKNDFIPAPKAEHSVALTWQISPRPYLRRDRSCDRTKGWS